MVAIGVVARVGLSQIYVFLVFSVVRGCGGAAVEMSEMELRFVSSGD